VAFGAIGIPVVVAADVSKLDLMTVSKIVGRQLPFLSVAVPFWVVCTMCGLKRTLEVLPAIIVAGVCFALSQFLSSNFHGPYLPDIISAIVSIIGMIILLRVWKPATVWHFPGEETNAASGPVPCAYRRTDVLRAWSSYIILAGIVFIWGLQGFKTAMAGTDIAIPWPGLHDLVVRTAPIAVPNAGYAANYAFTPLTAGGTAILFSGLIASCIMPGYGLGKALPCLFRTCRQLRFPIATIAMILGLAYIMNYSGMSSTLGLAFTNTGALFPLFAPLLGWLGVFLTGSDTSSNALFCSLQRTTAEAVGVDPHLTVAANSSGGVTGKMISPQSISVASAATGLIGKEGNLFRFTLCHSLAMTLIVCLITLLQAYWFSWMLPAAPPGIETL
jgi:lactate permease